MLAALDNGEPSGEATVGTGAARNADRSGAAADAARCVGRCGGDWRTGPSSEGRISRRESPPLRRPSAARILRPTRRLHRQHRARKHCSRLHHRMRQRSRNRRPRLPLQYLWQSPSARQSRYRQRRHCPPLSAFAGSADAAGCRARCCAGAVLLGAARCGGASRAARLGSCGGRTGTRSSADGIARWRQSCRRHRADRAVRLHADRDGGWARAADLDSTRRHSPCGSIGRMWRWRPRTGIDVATTLPALYIDLYQGDGSVRHLLRPASSGAPNRSRVQWIAGHAVRSAAGCRDRSCNSARSWRPAGHRKGS